MSGISESDMFDSGRRASWGRGIAAFFILLAFYYFAQVITAAIFAVCALGLDGLPLLLAAPFVPFYALFLWSCVPLGIILFIALPIIIIGLSAWKTARGGGITAEILIISTLIVPLIFADMLFPAFDSSDMLKIIRGVSQYVLLATVISWFISVPLCRRALRSRGLTEDCASADAAPQWAWLHSPWRRGAAIFFLFFLSSMIENAGQFLFFLPAALAVDAGAAFIALLLGLWCARGRPLTLTAILIGMAMIPMAVMPIISLCHSVRPDFKIADYGIFAVQIVFWLIASFLCRLIAWALGLAEAVTVKNARADCSALPQAEFIRGGDIDD